MKDLTSTRRFEAARLQLIQLHVAVKIAARLLIMKLNPLQERYAGPIQLVKRQWISKFRGLLFIKIRSF